MGGRLLDIVHRYLAVILGLAIVVAVVVIVPDRRAADPTGGLGGIPSVGQAPATGGTTPGPDATPLPGVTPGTTAAPGPGGTTSGGGSAAGGPGAVAAKTPGYVAGGPTCSGGARQVNFLPYSPLCHQFTGFNGGATSHGVTATTITATMRNTSDYDAGAQAIGASSFAAGFHDSKVLVDYLSSQYQLYGRKVDLQQFNGTGSFLAEAGGRDQSGANADAQQAYDKGAFAEIPIQAPGAYHDALTARHVVHFSLPDTLADLRTNYPYQYQYVLPARDYVYSGAADMVCGRMANAKAIYAGDATLSTSTRSFALIESTQQSSANNPLVNAVKQKCGATVERYPYDVNPGQYAPEAASIAAQLKAKNITTVVLLSDIIFSPIMTNAASANSYHPEWLNVSPVSNASTRQMSGDEVAHMIFLTPGHPMNFPSSQDNCYQVYLAASGGAAPQSNLTTIDLICSTLFEFFGALETAGANLNPATFGQGWFSQPPSTSAGQFGAWSWGAGAFCGCMSFNLQWWNSKSTNPYDGGSGLPSPCQEPSDLPYVNPNVGSGQLKCFS